MALSIKTSKAAKTIRAQTIAQRLRAILDPKGSKFIDPKDPIGDYIKGGPGAVRAFADVLNKSSQFKGDGLALEPGDMQGVATVADLGNAIVDWYRENGWQVTI